MHCHGRNCCSGPTGSPPLLVSLKIAVLWWCTGDCWENSCPTPPLLLHPSFPLNGAISSNTLGSGPQKSRRLRPIIQINWHEWAHPHAASGKEGRGTAACGCITATIYLLHLQRSNGRRWRGSVRKRKKERGEQSLMLSSEIQQKDCVPLMCMHMLNHCCEKHPNALCSHWCRHDHRLAVPEFPKY